MSKLLKATSWTTVASVVTMVITVLQLSILTHYLPPSTYGQFAIVNLMVEIFTAFSLGGISSFFIYKREISDKEKNSIILLSFFMGLFFLFVFNISSPYIANFFGNINLIPLFHLIAYVLPLSALSSQLHSLGIKAYKHQNIALVEIFSKTSSFIVTILLVDEGVYCLIYGILVYQSIRLLSFLYLFYSFKLFVTGVSINVIREAVSYGIYDLGSTTLNIVRRQLDVIILSITLNSNDLGIYHVVKQLASRPALALQPVLNKVALPSFGDINSSRDKLRDTFTDFFNIQLLIMCFIYLPMAIYSNLIFEILLGAEYSSYYIIFTFLCLYWFVRVTSTNLIGPLIQASGKTKINFYWNVVIIFPTFIVVYISASSGLLYLSVSMLIMQLFLIPLSNKFLINKVIEFSTFYVFVMYIKYCIIFIVPLLVLSYLIIVVDIENVFFKALSVLLMSGLILTITCFKSVALRQSLKRLKKF